MFRVVQFRNGKMESRPVPQGKVFVLNRQGLASGNWRKRRVASITDLLNEFLRSARENDTRTCGLLIDIDGVPYVCELVKSKKWYERELMPCISNAYHFLDISLTKNCQNVNLWDIVDFNLKGKLLIWSYFIVSTSCQILECCIRGFSMFVASERMKKKT